MLNWVEECGWTLHSLSALGAVDAHLEVYVFCSEHGSTSAGGKFLKGAGANVPSMTQRLGGCA